MTASGGATRETILATARSLLVNEGAASFSLREVARRTKLSPAAMYRHFASKEAMLDAVCAVGFQKLGYYLLRAMSEKTPRARLDASADAYLRFGTENPEDYRFIFMQPKAGRATGETFQMLVDRVRECMAARVLDKADPIETAATIWAHVHGLVSLRLSGHLASAGDEEEFARFYRRSTEKLVAGLSVNTIHKREKS
jgi:AcrR family transcriptional regulator